MIPGDRRADAFARYRAATDLPLLVLAALLVPLLLVPLLTDLPPATDAVLTGVDYLIWAVFAADYVIGLTLAPSRRHYVRTEWLTLILVVVPFLRPLRLMRSARALRVLRLTRVLAALGRGGTGAKRLLVRHRLHYAILGTGMLLVAGAALIDAVETGRGGPIENFADALWWAATTMTTVGYGDTYPVTPAGRGVAVVLMVAGIAFFGVLTANIAAFMIEGGQRSEIDALRERVEELIERLDAPSR